MAIKRLIQAALISAVLSAAGAVPTYAAPDWYLCKVLNAGPAERRGVQAVFVRLTHLENPPMFESTWFKVVPRWQREVLAVSMDAISSDVPVRVKTDPFKFQGEFPEIIGIYQIKRN